MAFRELRKITRGDADILTAFVRETASDAHAKGAVVGISGGIDSAVIVKLCADALGPENVSAVFMPVDSTPREDYRQTRDVCEIWGVKYDVVDIQPAVDAFGKMLLREGDDPLQKGNIMARCRMIVLYDKAKRDGCLVYGTTNRSELFMGYMTKFGDGAEDVTPMYDLYKTQVWELARIIGVPEEIVNKVPTAGLWEGQTDEEEMGITYLVLDRVLNAFEQGATDEEASEFSGADPEKVKELRAQIEKAEHKRKASAVPGICVGRA